MSLRASAGVAVGRVRSGLDDEIAAAGDQRFDVFDVADGARDVDRSLVVGAERAGPSLGECASALGSEFFDQPLLQPIVPSPGEVGDRRPRGRG